MTQIFKNTALLSLLTLSSLPAFSNELPTECLMENFTNNTVALEYNAFVNQLSEEITDKLTEDYKINLKKDLDFDVPQLKFSTVVDEDGEEETELTISVDGTGTTVKNTKILASGKLIYDSYDIDAFEPELVLDQSDPENPRIFCTIEDTDYIQLELFQIKNNKKIKFATHSFFIPYLARYEIQMPE